MIMRLTMIMIMRGTSLMWDRINFKMGHMNEQRNRGDAACQRSPS